MEKAEKLERNYKKQQEKPKKELEKVVIRLAGDSGDGMQLAGLKFTSASVMFGNDVSTVPDYPSEIRAPQGTLAGVSGFQIHFASTEIHSPGDSLDTLVAMNPAALKINLSELKPNGILICNEDSFTPTSISKAGFSSNPLEDESLKKFRVFPVRITKLNEEAVIDVKGLTRKQVNLTRNFFTLGLISWLYDRPLESTLKWIEKKFKKHVSIVEANTKALKAGYYFGETTEIFPKQYHVPKAKMEPGLYRYVSGMQALALGFTTAAQLAKKEIFFGAYPITPASDLLHELVKLRGFGIRTFQAEDEIAAIGSIIGAAFGGVLGVTATSGPGIALMSEALGLAVITELPLVVVDSQRAGPSTGMPTKPEQTDLLQVLFGRNGEAPIPVIAPQSPGDSFDMAIQSIRLATKFMTPVILLTDGFLVNNIDPWLVPNLNNYPEIKITHPTKESFGKSIQFLPYSRDDNLVRPWVIPGTPGLEHRIGGLEKDETTGDVSYNPINHETMVNLRAQKIANVANDLPLQEVNGPMKGDLLILSWGSTYGAAHSAAANLRKEGYLVADTNLRYLNPFPSNLKDIIKSYKKILIPELNKGQLQFLIQARYSLKTISLTKVQGKPFHVGEIQHKGEQILLGEDND